MIDVHKRRVSLLDKGFDLTPFGITRLFGLVRTNITVYDYFMKIGEVGGDGTLYYVFWDENGTFSETSPVSTTTTPTSTLFGDIKGSSTWNVNTLVCHLTGIMPLFNNSSTAFNGADVVDAGVIITSPTSGKPSPYYISNRMYRTNAPLSEIADDKKYTQTIICEPVNNGNLHGVFTNRITASTNSHFSIFLDKTANKLGARVVTDVDTYILEYIDNQNTSGQKNIQFTYDGDTKDIELFLNSVSQDNDTISGSYANSIYALGVDNLNTTNALLGYMPVVATHNRVLTQEEIENLNTILNQIF